MGNNCSIDCASCRKDKQQYTTFKKTNLTSSINSVNTMDFLSREDTPRKITLNLYKSKSNCKNEKSISQNADMEAELKQKLSQLKIESR